MTTVPELGFFIGDDFSRFSVSICVCVSGLCWLLLFCRLNPDHPCPKIYYLAMSLSQSPRRCVLPSNGDGRSDLEVTGYDDGQIRSDSGIAMSEGAGGSEGCEITISVGGSSFAVEQVRRQWSPCRRQLLLRDGLGVIFEGRG